MRSCGECIAVTDASLDRASRDASRERKTAQLVSQSEAGGRFALWRSHNPTTFWQPACAICSVARNDCRSRLDFRNVGRARRVVAGGRPRSDRGSTGSVAAHEASSHGNVLRAYAQQIAAKCFGWSGRHPCRSRFRPGRAPIGGGFGAAATGGAGRRARSERAACRIARAVSGQSCGVH